jgi:hypothetical protein
MFMKDRPAGVIEAPVGGLTRAVLGVSVVVILVFGLFPSALVRFSDENGFRPYPASPALGVNVPAQLQR